MCRARAACHPLAATAATAAAAVLVQCSEEISTDASITILGNIMRADVTACARALQDLMPLIMSQQPFQVSVTLPQVPLCRKLASGPSACDRLAHLQV
jgi:hypothetical protein